MALMTSFTNTTLIKSILPSDLRDFKRLIRLNSIAYNSTPGKSGNKKYKRDSNCASVFYAFHYQTILKFCILHHFTIKQKLKQKRHFVIMFW